MDKIACGAMIDMDEEIHPILPILLSLHPNRSRHEIRDQKINVLISSAKCPSTYGRRTSAGTPGTTPK